MDGRLPEGGGGSGGDGDPGAEAEDCAGGARLPDGEIRLVARGRGRAQIHQIVGGTQHVVHHHHYGDGPAVPLGLPGLRVWIDRMAADYREICAAGEAPGGRRQRAGRQRELATLQVQLAGDGGHRNGINQVRRLLAAGAVQYLHAAGRVPAEPLPEALVVDFAVFALWPVVQAPVLPAGWEGYLAVLTSPRLAVLVAAAREAGRGEGLGPEEFGRSLAERPFAHGVLALLEDLADPRRGGACLTALAVAARTPPPPQRLGGKATLGWLFGAGAVGGVTGAGAELAERVWEWLQEAAEDSPLRLWLAREISIATVGALDADGVGPGGDRGSRDREGGFLDGLLD
ncbi:hypothetical protein [Streptomyces sp. NPDC089799]|uniref:hypothetical protein n=1 Tax=Streptomyces sp. NPDC089799 TaxID=3155066 RepID=UPI00342A7255